MFTLFEFVNLILVGVFVYFTGASIRKQWRASGKRSGHVSVHCEKLLRVFSGLMTMMGSKFLLHFLGFTQVHLTCGQIAEMVVWLTARLFAKQELYMVGSAKLTEAGIKIVSATTDNAMIVW
jgi:hypothetical protein